MNRINEQAENDLNKLIEVEKKISVDQKDSYIISYPYILECFKRIKDFDEMHFVCGAHMVYGWMPKILHLHPDIRMRVDGRLVNVDLTSGADILTKVKKNQDISDSDLKQLKRLVNNSLVGPSKLLHFIAPETFAIWDSNVCNYFFPAKVEKRGDYWRYINRIKDISALSRCKDLRRSVSEIHKVGYIKISTVRAIELVIYLHMKKKNAVTADE